MQNIKGYFRNLWEAIKFYWVIVVIGIIVAVVLILTLCGNDTVLRWYEGFISLFDRIF